SKGFHRHLTPIVDLVRPPINRASLDIINFREMAPLVVGVTDGMDVDAGRRSCAQASLHALPGPQAHPVRTVGGCEYRLDQACGLVSTALPCRCGCGGCPVCVL